jgi:hypothetical protein
MSPLRTLAQFLRRPTHFAAAATAARDGVGQRASPRQNLHSFRRGDGVRTGGIRLDAMNCFFSARSDAGNSTSTVATPAPNNSHTASFGTTTHGIARFMHADDPSFDAGGNRATDGLTTGCRSFVTCPAFAAHSSPQNAIGSGPARTTAAPIETYVQGLLR